MTNTSEPTQLSALKRAYIALEGLQSRLAALENARREPIAVVGLGCRFPGADDPQAYWRLLRDGVDAVRQVPPDRWDVDAMYDPDPDAPGKIASRWGGFLERVDGFDPQLFGISPREAVSMDPQQRLLLEVAWEALEYAGIAPDSLSGSPTGVFVAISTSDYAGLQLQTRGLEGIDAYYASGVAHSVASGRLSYVLGLQGPSLSIDTACSSSLVAVHLALQSLRSGESRMALAGGVNLILTPDVSVMLSRYHMLATDGRCKTFDSRADGFVRGEGCGMVVLKRLSDALADGDTVLAIIRGSAVNQDGPSSGLTAPNGPAQEAVIGQALADAGVSASDIDYVEAHGTGTALGDPIEVQALLAVLGRQRPSERPLAIGSVKTNIGHLEMAAGIAGLIKTVLVLQHAQIPPHLHLSQLNPHIAWDQMPVVVPTTLSAFGPGAGRPLLAGVSSFGFSGTNAHVVLEAAPALTPVRPATPTPVRPRLFTLSARSRPAVDALAGRYADLLETQPGTDLDGLAHTAHTGRAHLSERAAVVADSTSELRSRLASVAQGETVAGVVRGQARERPRVAFLFTGQGAQYATMGRSLYAASPVFRATLDRCAALLSTHLERSLLDVLFEAPVAGTPALLDQTAVTQPALFALQYALAEVWRAFGVTPAAVLGHSVGAYAAACAAGIFSWEEGLHLVAERGRLMQALPSGGAMATVFADADSVAAAVAPYADRLAISALNGPGHVVVSGDALALDAALSDLQATGARSTPLHVSHAFHSPLVEPMLDALEAAARAVDFVSPRLRFISDLTGQMAGPEVANARYWRDHARQTVQFEQALHTLRARDVDALVEIGPHPVLLGLAAEIVPPADADGPLLLPSLRRGRDEWTTLLGSAGALFTRGVALEWPAIDGPDVRRLSGLPTYPFQRQRYWAAGSPTRPEPTVASTGHPLLGRRLHSALAAIQFESEMHADRLPYLQDHRVFGDRLLPATAYIEMALAAGAAALGDGPLVLEDMLIQAPLRLGPGEGAMRTTQVIVSPTSDPGAKVEVFSTDVTSETWLLHAVGALRVAPPGPPMPGSVDLRVAPPCALTAASVDLPALRGRCPRQISAAEHVATLAARGLDFGPSLRGIQRILAGDGEALGDIRLPDPPPGEFDGYQVHPALLDACLQVLGSTQIDEGETFLPMAIDAVRVISPPPAHVWSHATLRDTDPATSADMRVGDVRVYDLQGSLLVEVSGIHFRRVADAAFRPSTAFDPTLEWLYEVAWRPVPPLPDVEGSLFDPLAIADTVRSAAAARAVDAELVRYHALLPELEALSVAYIVQALSTLGWQPQPGTALSAAGLGPHLRIVERHHALLGRLLAILGEAGILHRVDDDGWQVVRVPAGADPLPRLRTLIADHPEGGAELRLLQRCGEALADVLSGARDPLQLLFPDGSVAEAEQLYEGSPSARAANALVQQAVTSGLAALPAHRRLRVLEVGAGTGGTTSFVVPLLPADRTDYVFTDISPLFLARARKKFERFPFIQYQLCDLERDPADQHLTDGSFDIILAANVVHATADLSQSLRHLERLLTPGGLLVLLEMTRPQALVDMSFGLTPGWWRFVDRDLRPASPLLSAERWPTLLTDLGFEHAVAIPEAAAGQSHQAVVLATAPGRGAPVPGAPSGAWLVVADVAGVGTHLAEHLRSRGHRCVLAQPAADYAPAGPDSWHLRTGEVGDWERLLAEAATRWQGIVHLTSLSGTDDQRHGCGAVLALVQALARSDQAPRLWLVTRATQPVTFATDLEPAHATLWGLGSVIAQEYPELRCVRVDLDMTSADAAARSLLREMLAPDGEDQVGIRDGRRYVARLVPSQRRHAETPCMLSIPTRGSLDNLELQPVDRRMPGPGEVEIRVRASGLNFRDVLHALALDFQDVSGTLREPPGQPAPLGGECAGEIVRVGPGVEGISIGDQVVALAPGSLATYVIAAAELVAAKPDRLSWEQAAALPIAWITAEYALQHIGGLRSGERVLIHAAAGGVGLAAVRLAQRIGAEVFATAGSPEKRAFLRAEGVQHVFDSRTTAFAGQVRALTGGWGVDVVLNSLAGDFVAAGLDSLADGGRFLEIGKRDHLTPEQVVRLDRSLQYHVIDWAETARDTPAVIGTMLRALVTRPDLQPLPVRAFPLESAAEAFRYMAQARHIGKIVMTIGAPAGGDVSIHADASYLVTGGLSGLGLRVAEWLTERGARHLVLVGRRAPSAPALASLEAMQRGGVRIEVVSADISRAEDAARVFAVLDSLPPLRGVIHSAGVLDDATLVHQDWQRFERVLAPKVTGAVLLHQLTRQMQLDFFVLFSSLASVVGAPGQANHAAANAFLDSLAHARRRQGLAALSINWAAWSEIGAAAERGVDQRAANVDVGAISPADGLHVLGGLLQRDCAQVSVIPAEPAALVRRLANGVARPLFAELSPAASSAVATRSVARSAAREILEATSARRRELLLDYARQQAGRILGLAPTDVPDRVPLSELGLDSLMAVELRNSLGSGLELERPLPATLVFDFPTISAIAEYLARQLSDVVSADSSPAGVLPVASADHGDAERALEAIEDLSDEDVERLLAERAAVGA